jgi:branched-chain amino acid transport system permease protein
MDTVALLVAGLAAGSLYAVVALGIVLVYRSTRVLNFAHGDLATFGTYVTFALLGRGHGFVLSGLLGAAAGAAVAVFFYRLVLAPAQRRGAGTLAGTMLTLGLGLVLQGVVLGGWSPQPERLPLPVDDAETVRLGGLAIGRLSLWSLAAGVAAATSLYLIVQHTRLGLALRAVSEDPVAAQTLGIPTRAVSSVAWGASAALAVGAGLLIAAQVLLDPFFMLDPFLKGFAAATLGGLDSLPGAVVGGLLLGAAEGLVGATLGLEYRNALAFVVIVLVLLVRPAGLLGRELKERV